MINLHAISTKIHGQPTFSFKPFLPNATSSFTLHGSRGALLISGKLKLLLTAAGAVALTTMLVRAMHTHSARADLTNALSREVSPGAGQIIPSHRRGILACGAPISDCEMIMMMLPTDIKFSPREINKAGALDRWPGSI
jgi:hypothetical protein